MLEQTYSKFEIILINDGSTDSSGKICDSYVEHDVRIKVYHQINQRQIITRSNLLAKASGEYYLFLDADDYWDKDLLETINNAILKYDCDMVIFNFNKIFPNRTYISKPVFENLTIFNKHNKELIFNEIIKGSRLNNLWIKAVKSSIIDDTDYTKYKTIKNAEDLLRSLPLLYNAEKILYLDKAMYNYRINPESISHIFNINKYEDVAIVKKVVLKYMQMINMNDEKNLIIFYNNYIKNLLRYISNLINSKADKLQKKRILLKIHNISLYKDALSYINSSYLPIYQLVRLHLFKKECYILLNFYEKILIIIKKIYHSLMYITRKDL